jgi:glyoxylase-like metal-dependent hydrolase (beta-lactamase superfamily II)
MKVIKKLATKKLLPRALWMALACLALSAMVQAQAQPDFANTQIKTTKVTENFYTLEGQGGMIGILVGPDGVFMVDSQYAPLTEKIVAAVKQITDKPIRFMVNTHVHPDHTGGDENLGKMGVIMLSRDELRKRLADGTPAVNGVGGRAPFPPVALPMITYEGVVTFHMNGEDIKLIPIAHAHTDGDTMVQFVKNNVIMTGDFYRSIQYPNIDRANGGSLSGMIEGLTYIVSIAGPDTKIIPGHGPTVTKAEVAAHRDMIVAVRDKVAQLMEQGKSEQEVIAAHPTADFDSKVSQPGTTADRFVGQLYAEMKPRIMGSGQ